MIGQGRYCELLLTNRQYAFARIGDTETAVVLVNNDENEAHLSVPLPGSSSEIIDLETRETVGVQNGRIEKNVAAGGSCILIVKH